MSIPDDFHTGVTRIASLHPKALALNQQTNRENQAEPLRITVVYIDVLRAGSFTTKQVDGQAG